jgi:hypothetical protein
MNNEVTKEIKVKDKLLLSWFEREAAARAGLDALTWSLMNANKKTWTLAKELYPELKLDEDRTASFDSKKKVIIYHVPKPLQE